MSYIKRLREEINLLNKKIELSLTSVVFIAVLSGFSYLLYISQTVVFANYIQIFLNTIIVTFLIFKIYAGIRNKIFYGRIEKYLRNREYLKCKEILDTAIKAQPRILRLKIQKNMVFAFEGNMKSFISQYSEIQITLRSKKSKEFIKLSIIKMALECILGFEIEFIDLNKKGKKRLKKILKNQVYSDLFYAIYNYKNNQWQTAMSFANSLFKLQPELFSCVGAYILTECLLRQKDVAKAKLYEECLKNSEYYNRVVESAK